MALRTVAALAVGGTVAGLGWLLAKYGVFRKVVWEEEGLEGFVYAYVDHQGPYKEIGPKFHEIEEVLKAAGVENSCQTHRGVGVYYDKPGQVPDAELRSEAGTILSSQEAAKAQKAGIKTRTVARQSAGLKTTFPLLGSASILIGVLKVYPALTEYCTSRGISHYEVAEIYDFCGKETTYFAFQKED